MSKTKRLLFLLIILFCSSLALYLIRLTPTYLSFSANESNLVDSRQPPPRQEQLPPRTHPPPERPLWLDRARENGVSSIQYSRSSPVATPTTAKGRPSTSTTRWKAYGATLWNASSTTSVRRNGSGLVRRKIRGENETLGSQGTTEVKTMDMLMHRISTCSSQSESYQNTLREKYGKFLEGLAKYASYHAQERNGSNVRKLVWYCGSNACGGIGDRMKGATFALILAIISRRVLLFEWRDSRLNRETYLEPNIIDWRLTENERTKVFDLNNHIPPGETERNGSVTFFHVFNYMGRLDVSQNAMKAFLLAVESNVTWIAFETCLFPNSLVHNSIFSSVEFIRGHLSKLGLTKLKKLEIDKLIGLVFRYFFTFSKDIAREINEARSMLGLCDLAYVGIHVRTGFVGAKRKQDGNHPKLHRKSSQWEQELKCAINIATGKYGPNSIIFVATDSEQVKKMALEKYKERVRSLNNSVVHMDKLYPPPEGISDYEKEGVMSMWVELVLLAEAESVVMGESGFAFLAASLCLLPPPQIVNGQTCAKLGRLEKFY